ncbi:MAG: Na+ dependent nucleoside transporter N-terminal domain-containing protein, partial [Psychrobium sp.]
MNVLMGIVGIITLITIAILMSENRKAINIRTVVVAFLLQAGLGAFVLYVPAGQSVLEGISGAVQSII